MKAPSIDAGEDPLADAIEGVEVEYRRSLNCWIRGRQTCTLRVAEHLVILLVIIATFGVDTKEGGPREGCRELFEVAVIID